MNYRDVTPADHETIAQQYVATFAQEPWNEVHELDTILTYIKQLAAMNTFVGRVVEDDTRTEILGVALGYIKPWYQGQEYVMDTFFIVPKYQSQKIGTALLKDVKTYLTARDIPAIMLDTDRDTPAETFYKKQGFSANDTTILMFGSTK